MKTKSNKTILVLTGTLMAASQGFGTVINYSGSIADNSGAEVADWRTATTAKTFDTEGDGIYGTLGYSIFRGDQGGGGAAWNVGITQSQAPGLSLMQPGALGAGLSLIVGNFSGAMDWDNPATAPADRNMGYAGPRRTGAGSTVALTQSFLFNVTSSPGDLRMGIASDSLGDVRLPLSQLRVVAGGSQVDATLVGAPQNSLADMYFFDLYDLQSGDTIEIWLASSFTHDTFVQPSINGVTFDAAPFAIPEPSTLAMAALGLAAVTLARRLGWRKG